MSNDITNATLAFIATFQQCGRRSGRTTRMLQNLKDGDIVVCKNNSHANHIRHMAEHLGLGVNFETRVIPVDGHRFGEFMRNLIRRRSPNSVVHFDHHWVEHHWEHRVTEVSESLNRMMQDINPAQSTRADNDPLIQGTWLGRIKDEL